jgi:hypothetical protein
MFTIVDTGCEDVTSSQKQNTLCKNKAILPLL